MVDLHTHSHCSDGSLSPAQLLRAAEKAGVTAVALTDHNTVAGLPEFTAAAGTVEAVPGVEFSADYQGKELHILALFLPRESWAAVDSRLAQLHRDKEASNRAHVAQVLTRKGYTGSVQEAFRTLLRRHGGFYVPPKLPDALETIAFIKKQGAVAVLAHPLLSLEEMQLHTFLSLAKAAGLDAMETMYPRFDENATQTLRAMAEEFGLAESGGSDFHGDAKPEIRIGVGTGTLAVRDAVVEKLRERSRRK